MAKEPLTRNGYDLSSSGRICNATSSEQNYGELREALTDIYYAVQHIHLILRFKYYERPGFKVRLEIFVLELY